VTRRSVQEVLGAIDQPLRTDVQYVTTYRGKPIPGGRKSMTLTIVYQSSEGTLRSEQVPGVVQTKGSVLKPSGLSPSRYSTTAWR